MNEKQLERLKNRLAVFERRELMRPMSRPEMTDLAVSIYRKLGTKILSTALIPTLAIYIVCVCCARFALPSLFTTTTGTSTNQQFADVAIALAFSLLAAMPICIFCLGLISGSTAKLTWSHLLGEKLNLREAERTARKKSGKLAWVIIRASLPTCIGFVFSVGLLGVSALISQQNDTFLGDAAVAAIGLAGVSLSILLLPFTLTRSALAPCVLVFEKATPKEACKRSLALLSKTPFHGTGYEMFSTLAALNFLVGIGMLSSISFLISMFNEGIGLETFIQNHAVLSFIKLIISTLPVFLTLLVMIPLWSVVSTIVYVERRIRLEGFDIEVLAHDAQTVGRKVLFEL